MPKAQQQQQETVVVKPAAVTPPGGSSTDQQQSSGVKQQQQQQQIYAVISPKTIRLFAQCVASMSAADFDNCESVCSLLAEDLSYRLRQIIQLAALAARRQNQPCLTVDHIDFAVRHLSCDRLFASIGNRFQPMGRYLRVKGTDLYETEKFSLLLTGVAKSPLVINKTDSRFSDHSLVSEWLNNKDPSSTVQSTAVHDAYIAALLNCLVSGSPQRMSAVYSDLLGNNRLQPIVGRLLALLTAVLKNCSHDLRISMATLRTFQCLLLNPFVTLVATKRLYLATVDFCMYALTGSLMTFCQLGDDDECSSDYLLLREVAARIMADTISKYAPLLGHEETGALLDRLIDFVDQTLTHNLAKCYGPLVCLGYLAEHPQVCAKFFGSPLFTKVCSFADNDNSSNNDTNLANQFHCAPPSPAIVLSINYALSVFAHRLFRAIHYHYSATSTQSHPGNIMRYLPYCHLLGELLGLVVSCQLSFFYDDHFGCTASASAKPKPPPAVSQKQQQPPLPSCDNKAVIGLMTSQPQHRPVITIKIAGCNSLPVRATHRSTKTMTAIVPLQKLARSDSFSSSSSSSHHRRSSKQANNSQATRKQQPQQQQRLPLSMMRGRLPRSKQPLNGHRFSSLSSPSSSSSCSNSIALLSLVL